MWQTKSILRFQELIFNHSIIKKEILFNSILTPRVQALDLISKSLGLKSLRFELGG